MLSSLPGIFGIKPNEVSTTPVHPLGSKGFAPDGRIYRYSRNSTTALVRGVVTKAADVTDDHENVVFQAAGAVGDTVVNITISTTSIAASEYTEGYLVIVDDAGEGHTHKIKRHESGTGTIQLTLETPLLVATTTATTVTLVRNLYNLLTITNTGQNDIPTGVTPRAIAISEYYWSQTGGIAAVLQDENITAGNPVTIGSSVNGAVELRNAVAEPIVGIVPAGVNTVNNEHSQVFLTLDN